MSKKWEDFEVECFNYLNDKFGNCAEFTRMGDSDSTVSDILVTTKSGRSFYIEVKHSPAQCGQFVLIPDIDTKEFNYSELNKTQLNDDSLTIIEHMNKNFELYNAHATGKDVVFPDCENVFVN